MVKNPSAMQETQVWSLGQKDPLKKGMATHSSILAWRIHGQRSLVVRRSLQGRKESDTTKQLTLSLFFCSTVPHSDFLLLKITRLHNVYTWHSTMWRSYHSFSDHFIFNWKIFFIRIICVSQSKSKERKS